MQQFYANGRGMPVKTDSTTQVTVYPPRHIHNQNVFLQDPIKKICTTRTGSNTKPHTNLKMRRIEDSFKLASASVREVVDVSSKYPRDLFDTGSGAVREVFDCCSGATRRTTEAHPKQYRSCPEPVPKRTRSAPEGHPNSTRRNRLVFYRFFDLLKAGIKYRCSKDVVLFTQLLRKITEVPLMYRECTVSVRGVYRKGTGDLLRSYWRSTTDLLNACTSGVDKRYSKSRRVVGVEAMKNKVTLCLAGLLCFSRRLFSLMALKNIRILCLGFLCFMLFNLSTAWAQSAETRTAEGQSEIKPLQIGDTIPEELWHLPLQVVNHPDGKDTITLNDYRDKKLIILDFWGTHCGPCLQSLLKIEDMLQTFTTTDLERLKVVPVTHENIDRVEKFLERSPKHHGILAGSLTNGKQLTEYFPHRMIPHVVWIGTGGRILSVTGAEEILAQNIIAVLNSKTPISLEEKVDLIDFDRKQSFVAFRESAFQKRMINASVLTSFVKGVSSSVLLSQDSLLGITSFRVTNLPITSFFIGTDRSLREIPFRRWELPEHIEVNGRLLSNFNDRSNWNEDYLFCYDFVSHSLDMDRVMVALQEDFKRLFGMSKEKTTRLEACYVLSCDRQHISTDEGRMTNTKQLLKVLNNNLFLPLHYVSDEGSELFVDDTTMRLLRKAQDVQEVQSLLRAIGIDITRDNRELDFLEFQSSFNQKEETDES